MFVMIFWIGGVSRQRAPCLLSIVIAASCALLFAIATDELFNGLNSNGEIAVGLCVEGPVLLNIWEFPHRSRQSSYHTQFILTAIYKLRDCQASALQNGLSAKITSVAR
jgi:hypothetical protein